ISGGENIYPAEVEHALLDLDPILNSAAIGVEDARWGETGMAFVVLRDSFKSNPHTGLELREQLGSVLARYKLPREVHRAAQLTREAAGETQKNALRASIALTS